MAAPPVGTEALDRCPWLCSAPRGPNTPFDWPVFFALDSLRLLLAVGAAVLIAISVWSVRRAVVPGQKTRFAGAIGLYLIVAGTELDHLGDTPNWRFFVALTSIPLLVWGHYRHLRHELPAKTRARQDTT